MVLYSEVWLSGSTVYYHTIMEEVIAWMCTNVIGDAYDVVRFR